MPAAIDFRLQVAIGQKLHRALQVVDPAQDIAADIEPDEQRRADQRQAAQRQHDRGRQRNLLPRPPGRGIGVGLHAIHQLLDADAEADIELAGLVENDLAVVVGVEFLLADLEDAGLAFAQRQQFQRGFFQGFGAVVFGQQIEVGFDARLRLLKFLLDCLERVAAVSRQRRDHVGRHQVAGGDDVAELLHRPRGFRGVVLREVGRSEDGVDPHLRVHHRRIGGGDEAGLGAAQRLIQFLMLGRGVEPLLGRGAEALDGVVDILDGLVQRRHHVLVGAEFDDLAEFFERDLLGRFHRLGAFLQRFLAARGQQRRPLAGKGRALGCELQARGQPRNVPSAQVDHHLAELAQHHAGADADDNRHSRDARKGGKQAAPDAPSQPPQAQSPEFARYRWQRHEVPAPVNLEVNRVAVSRYLVNKIGKMPRILLISPPPDKKAGARPAFPYFEDAGSAEDQYLATTGPPQLKR